MIEKEFVFLCAMEELLCSSHHFCQFAASRGEAISTENASKKLRQAVLEGLVRPLKIESSRHDIWFQPTQKGAQSKSRNVPVFFRSTISQEQKLRAKMRTIVRFSAPQEADFLDCRGVDGVMVKHSISQKGYARPQICLMDNASKLNVIITILPSESPKTIIENSILRFMPLLNLDFEFTLRVACTAQNQHQVQSFLSQSASSDRSKIELEINEIDQKIDQDKTGIEAFRLAGARKKLVEKFDSLPQNDQNDYQFLYREPIVCL